MGRGLATQQWERVTGMGSGGWQEGKQCSTLETGNRGGGGRGRRVGEWGGGGGEDKKRQREGRGGGGGGGGGGGRQELAWPKTRPAMMK